MGYRPFIAALVALLIAACAPNLGNSTPQSGPRLLSHNMLVFQNEFPTIVRTLMQCGTSLNTKSPNNAATLLGFRPRFPKLGLLGDPRDVDRTTRGMMGTLLRHHQVQLEIWGMEE